MSETPVDAPAASVDAPVTGRTADEMGSLVRVLFGVADPQRPSDPVAEPAGEPLEAPPLPAPASAYAESEASIPLQAPTAPAVVPTPEAPRQDSAAALPFSDIPLADSLPGPAASGGLENARPPQRRAAGPTPELLEEIAFLDE